MATIERTRRLTLVQQISRDETYKVGGLKKGRLALEVHGPKGIEMRAVEVLRNLPAFLVRKDVEVKIYTPLGVQLNPAMLVRKSAEEIDAMAAEVDRLAQAAVGRRPEIQNLPEVVRIEEGTFPVAGSNLFGDTKPTEANVKVSAFMAGRYPVTVAEYWEYVKATGYKATGDNAADQEALLADRSKDRHPMVYLTQEEKLAYARWVSEQTGQHWYILSAAQQERIRRGQEGRLFPWGPEWKRPPHLNRRETVPVDAWTEGQTPEGIGGLGIVWEATRSRFGDYDPNVTDNPEGPSEGEYVDVRGGSAWDNDQGHFNGAYRVDLLPDYRLNGVGFRLGRDL